MESPSPRTAGSQPEARVSSFTEQDVERAAQTLEVRGLVINAMEREAVRAVLQAVDAVPRAELVEAVHHRDYAEAKVRRGEALARDLERAVSTWEEAARVWERSALDAEARCDELQAAVDKAHSALSSSAYVGGPSEREAFRMAGEALGRLATQHIGANPEADRLDPKEEQ